MVLTIEDMKDNAGKNLPMAEKILVEKNTKDFNKGIEAVMNDAAKSLTTAFQEDKSISDEQQLAIKNAAKEKVAAVFTKYVRNLGIQLQIHYNPDNKKHPFNLENKQKAMQKAHKMIEDEIAQLKEKIVTLQDTGVDNDYVATEISAIQNMIMNKTNALSELKKFDKTFDEEKLAKLADDFEARLKAIDTSIDDGIDRMMTNLKEKGSIFKETITKCSNETKADICGAITCLAALAVLIVGISLAVIGGPASSLFMAGIITTYAGSAIILGLGIATTILINNSKETEVASAQQTADIVNPIIEKMVYAGSLIENNLKKQAIGV